MDISPQFANQCRKDAIRKYKEEQQKFGLQMMLMGYYKVKSLLSEEGLKKVIDIDDKREAEERFNEEFSEIIWKATEDIWEQALGQLMIKISNAYGLKIGKDLRIDLPEDDSTNLDFFV